MRYPPLIAISLALISLIVPGSSGASGIRSASPQQESIIVEIGNIARVYNQPTSPTTFRITQPMVVTKIIDYHWNNARGAMPGTIALRSPSGRTLGPWSATGSPGQGGVVNAYWTATVNLILQPGEYTVIDSDPATWAQNSGTGGRGFIRVLGYAASKPTPTPQATPTVAPTPVSGAKWTAITEDRSNRNVLIWVEGKEPKSMMDVLNYHLEPGWKGTLSISMPAAGKITFVAGYGEAGSAGQYDKRLTSCVWSGDPKDATKLPYIIFEGNGTLTCSTINKK